MSVASFVQCLNIRRLLEMKNYDYILFDLDGTLTDSKPGITECIAYALEKENIPYTNDILDQMVGPPFRVSMHDFLGLEIDEIEKLIEIYRGVYEVYGYKNCKVFDGVRDMLSALKHAGKVLAVATSKPIKFTQMIMRDFELGKYFDYVAGASSDASKEAKSDVIQSALDNLHIEDKSKVLMVGDRLYDIEGAHAQGVDCAAVLYGYGSKEEFEKYGAEYILSSPKDVVELVLENRE